MRFVIHNISIFNKVKRNNLWKNMIQHAAYSSQNANSCHEIYLISVIVRCSALLSEHDDVMKWKLFCVTGPWGGGGGNSPATGEFPSQRPATRSFDAFFDLRQNKRPSKQSGSWWFETWSRLLCDDRWMATRIFICDLVYKKTVILSRHQWDNCTRVVGCVLS